VYLCDTCSGRVHSHKDRASHKPERCGEITEAGELELLSVICIETSHYVCFTRDSEGKWVFSDSMANRLCEWSMITTLRPGEWWFSISSCEHS